MAQSRWKKVETPANLFLYRPVVLITAGSKDETAIFTLSHTISLKEERPKISIILNGRHPALPLIKKYGEYGISIPDTSLATAVFNCAMGNHTKEGDVFSNLGLTAANARSIDTPVIAEAAAAIECKVSRIHRTGKTALIIADIVYARADRKHFVSGTWRLGKEFQMIHHVGGIHYFQGSTD